MLHFFTRRVGSSVTARPAVPHLVAPHLVAPHRGAPKLVAACAALVLAGPALTAAGATPAAAQSVAPQANRQHAAPAAEAFVQSEANKALAILRDSTMSVSAKKAGFLQLHQPGGRRAQDHRLCARALSPQLDAGAI